MYNFVSDVMEMLLKSSYKAALAFERKARGKKTFYEIPLITLSARIRLNNETDQ
jgi:hypothetical protein